MRPILDAAAMRAAEADVIAAGTDVDTLMERAGLAVAQAAQRFSGICDALVLCGPGNNGGDGYVAARHLAATGVHVRVAASASPATDAARAASARWNGAVEPIEDAAPAPLLVDALFGTGLKRELEPLVNETLLRLADAAIMRLAVDLPSGVASDDGALLSPVPRFDATIALGALKPAHLLAPAADCMGRLIVADIGVTVASDLVELSQPVLPRPGPDDHKYTRGMVVVLGGAMPGAARLAVLGAARSGAGYVQLHGEGSSEYLPAAIVHRVDGDLSDRRIGAIVVGPGLGRQPAGRLVLEAAMASGRPLVVDADGLWHLGARRLDVPTIITPHEAEFARLFGPLPGNKVARARAAALSTGAVVVLKGSDTVVAAPDGRAAIAPPGSHDLATAGTGDVLAGVCGTMLAQLGDPFAAACAAVWLHAAAARAIPAPFIADDLAMGLPAAVARCR